MSRERPGPVDRDGAPTDEDISWALRDTQRAYDAVNQALARRMEMNLTDLAALDALVEEGPHGPVELGNRLGIRSASATTLVDRLERAGHVERRPHSEDRRRVEVRATPAAEELMWLTLQPLIAGLQRASENLDDRERRVVHGYLLAVADALRSFTSDCN